VRSLAQLPELFSPEEIERARRYHRPLYWSVLVDLALGVALLAVLSFSALGDRLYAGLSGLAWWVRTPAFTAAVLSIAFVLRLPLSYWRSYVHEKRWGFSTQSLWGWVADRAKGMAIGLVLTSGVVLGFIGLARAFPQAWPTMVAPGGAVLVLVLSFVAPVVFEPIFNRFAPVSDEGLASDLRALADRAGVPIRDVLVADASRRTKRENAYVSGLGPSRRVVLYDTLLSAADRHEVSLIVAHELGHRRMRHVARGTVMAMAGIVVGSLVMWRLLSTTVVLHAAGAAGAGDPRVVPFVLLTGAAMQLAAAPFESALSRRWESAADRFSLELIGDLATFERSHRDLATANLIDLDPPRIVYRMFFTHPTPPERIAASRRWAAELRLAPLPPTTA
jgi:STE24 endopeptidase